MTSINGYNEEKLYLQVEGFRTRENCFLVKITIWIDSEKV